MVEIIRHAAPQVLDDISRGARPFFAGEFNHVIRVALADGSIVLRDRRMRLAAMLDDDQTRVHHVWKDMGPATNEDPVVIPCDGNVEMGHIHELLDAAKEKRQARIATRLLLKPERDAALARGLTELAYEYEAHEKGLSTFGPGGVKQRSS